MDGNESRLQTLYARRAIARAAVKLVSESPDDPRQPDALRHYQAQLAEIDAAIAEITGRPPDVVVGLKTADLFARIKE